MLMIFGSGAFRRYLGLVEVMGIEPMMELVTFYGEEKELEHQFPCFHHMMPSYNTARPFDQTLAT